RRKELRRSRRKRRPRLRKRGRTRRRKRRPRRRKLRRTRRRKRQPKKRPPQKASTICVAISARGRMRRKPAAARKGMVR
ncbi:cell envelope integrity protein TolA, partial [Salmonella enterica subsp. enterica serovar Infantis]